ncbi:MAG: hypothetical protein LBH12_01785 [Dysgonamonadaceae bacterium]|jgi:phosphate transport system protein|nr:hypothetical protein [Dysgonamonadaceae bacterium]
MFSSPYKKKLHHQELNNDFEILSTSVLSQLKLTEDIFQKGWVKEAEKELTENAERIHSLGISFIKKLSTMVLLYSPRAKELRKVVSVHEVVLFLEKINQLLLNIVDLVKQIRLDESSEEDFLSLASKAFEILDRIANASSYSFYKGDKVQAYNILEEQGKIERITAEMKEHLIASFQDISLSGQNLLNVINMNNILYILNKINDYALDIAKETIFVMDGIHIRTQKPQRMNGNE